MMHAERPVGTQYATPSTMRGKQESSMIRLDRGAAKNTYLIRDDAGCPAQAVAAAERMAEILR